MHCGNNPIPILYLLLPYFIIFQSDIYHTLEPHCGIIPSQVSPPTNNISDTQNFLHSATNVLPIYQEINDVSTSRQRTTATTENGDSTPNTSSSLPSFRNPLSVHATDSDTPNQVG